MRSYIAVIVAVDHDGTMTAEEMSATVGVWVDLVPPSLRTITSETEDHITAEITIVKAVAAREAVI